MFKFAAIGFIISCILVQSNCQSNFSSSFFVNPTACSPSCQNGGLCITINKTSTNYCACTSGWNGPACSVPVLSCATTTCLNGGLCTYVGGIPYCACTSGFTGQNCENPPVISKSCSYYNVMPNYDIRRIVGVWYDFASTDGFFDRIKCTKNVFDFAPEGNNFMNNTLTALSAAGNSPLLFPVKYKYDSQGNFYTNRTATDTLSGVNTQRQVQAKLSPIYTDYDNIIIAYMCWNEANNSVQRKNEQVYIMTRGRGFNSFSQFLAAISSLNNLNFDFSRVKLIFNDNTCSN